MRAFLETGYRLAQAQDDRVALAQLYSMPTTSPALKTAIRAALSTSGKIAAAAPPTSPHLPPVPPLPGR
jgi:hypothetical protein